MFSDMNQKRKIALYCRVAREDAIEIEAQRDSLRSFAIQHGYENFIEYYDNGYSGNSLDRPAFAQMETDISANIIDTVLVRCVDRVARDYMLRERWLESLNKRGATIIAMDGSHEPIPLMPELVNAINQSMRKRNRRQKKAIK